MSKVVKSITCSGGFVTAISGATADLADMTALSGTSKLLGSSDSSTAVAELVPGTNMAISGSNLNCTLTVPTAVAKASCKAATTVAGTLFSSFASGSVIDGITLVTADRILIKNQAAPAENGIYVVNVSGPPTRAADADTSAEVTPGMMTYVESGTLNAGTVWILTTLSIIILGTTGLSFGVLYGPGTYSASNGIVLTGTNFAPTYGTASNTVCQGNDSRLSDARTPVGTALTSAKVWVGDGSNLAQPVNLSGQVSITNTGVATIAGDITPASVVATGYGLAGAQITATGAVSESAWTIHGVGFQSMAATYTDTSSTTGTHSQIAVHALDIPTIASSNTAVVWTEAATLYIWAAPTAGANTSFTNAYGLYVGGKVRTTNDMGIGAIPAAGRNLTLSKTSTDTQALFRGIDITANAASTTSANAADFTGLFANPSITAGNTKDWTSATGFSGFVVDQRALASSTGTITNTQGMYVITRNSGSMTMSNVYGVRVDTTTNSGTITGIAGLAVNAQTAATNNTLLLLGTTTIPSGNFGIHITQGTVTASTPALNSLVTWNSGGVTFTHFKCNITNTASAADSLIADWQVGGVSKFAVSKLGEVRSGPLVTVSGIDAKTTGTTSLYTVPTGKTLIVTGGVIRCTAASSITVAPTLGIGVAAGEDDVFTSTTLTGLTASGKTWNFSVSGLSLTVAAASVVKLGIDTGSTGTSQTIAVDLLGYFV